MNDPTHHVISALPGWSAAQTMRYNKRAALIWHPIIAWTIRHQMDNYVIAHSALPVIAGGSSSSQGLWAYRRPDGKFQCGDVLFDSEGALMDHFAN